MLQFRTTTILLVISLLYSFSITKALTYRNQPLNQQGYLPVESIQFSHRNIPSPKHPFLFISPDDLAKAQIRSQEKTYQKAVETLNTQADKAFETKLESIDNAWWQNEKNKDWSQTYPIIYEKTCLQPIRIILPAYNAALRYAIYQKSRDADAAKKILLHLSSYTFEYEHYDVGMNYAVWGHFALRIYDLFFDQFNSNQKQQFDAFFSRMAQAVLKNDIYWIENNIGGGINNHLAWHKMMLGLLGLFYQRDDLVQYALHGPRGVVPLLDDGIVDDGLWCESSLCYHFTAIIPMVYLAHALRSVAYPQDLYTIKTPQGRNLRQSFDAVFGVLFPDGLIPPIGDAYGRRVKLQDEFLYVYAYKAYHDPRYAWLLQNAKSARPETLFLGFDIKNPEPPKIKTRLYPEHGYVFLREREDQHYWNSDSWCAFLTYDKSGVHANQDKLSLMLFGCEKLLTPDVEARATVPHAFSAKVQRELNRSALSQNTVMIDRRDQRGIGELLSLEEFRDLPHEKTAAAADRKGLLYQGVKQSRTIIVRPEYVLDVFQIVSDQLHEIHWITHALGNLQNQKSSLQLKPSEFRLPGPGHWLRNFSEAKSDNDFWIAWQEDDVRFKMTVADQPDTRILSCGYPQTDQPDCPLIPMLLLERRAAKTIYAVLYQAGRKELPNFKIKFLNQQNGKLIYQINGPGTKRKHAVFKLD